jgi:cell division transport system ATP-binding protein
MIAFDHVTKSAGNRAILTDATFAIEPGEWVTIQGESGSGKSTLVRLLLRAEDPTSGRIQVDGVALASLPVPLLQIYRSRIGVIFQEPTFLDYATVEENVALPLELQGMGPAKILKLIAPALQHVGLASKAYLHPSELSRAERMLTCLARALIHEPSIVIADEPLSDLNEPQRAAAIALLKERHAAGATVIVLVRDAQDTQELGGRLLHLAGGHVEAAVKAPAKPRKTVPHHHVLQHESAAAEEKEVTHADEPSDAEPKIEAEGEPKRKVKITAIHS